MADANSITEQTVRDFGRYIGAVTMQPGVALFKGEIDGAPGIPSLRTLGTGSNQAAAGDDPRFGANGALVADTMADLRLLSSSTDNVGCRLAGYYASADGGGGNFYWDNDSVEADDAGTIIQPTAIVTGRWKRIIPDNIYNVKWFGAKGDGVTNDTTAMQTAIDSTPRTGTTFFPIGRYLYTNLTVTDDTDIAGEGFWVNVSAEFGNAAWSDPAEIYGSLLISTATSGISFSIGRNDRSIHSNIKDVAIIGPGTGTSTGLELGKLGMVGLSRIVIDNVFTANFNKGMSLTTLDSTYRLARAGGCNTGIKIEEGGANNNYFEIPIVERCTDYGMFIATSQTQQIDSPLFQANFGVSLAVQGQGVLVNAPYFENAGGTLAIHVMATSPGLGNNFTCYNMHVGHDPQDAVQIDSDYAIFVNPQSDAGVTINGNNCFLLGAFNGTITDNGVSNRIWNFSGTDEWLIGDHDLRLFSGKALRLNTTTTSPDSYIGRNGATGDTDISSSSYLTKIVQSLDVANDFGVIGNISTTTSATPLAQPSVFPPANRCTVYEHTINAYRTGGSRGTGSVGDVASWKVRTVVSKAAGAPTIVYQEGHLVPTFISSDLDAAGLAVSITAGATHIECSVIGATSVNLTWGVATQRMGS